MRVGTRKSPLALKQTQDVCDHLIKLNPNLSIEQVTMETIGDQNIEMRFSAIGEKSLFTKELDQALMDHKIDLAVHSVKDIPTQLDSRLTLACVTGYSDERDAFVSNNYKTIESMPADGVIGTASLRRQALVLSQYQHLKVKMLRGNVNTRLKKLDEGQYDAIVLASAGLMRLGLEDRIRCKLDPKTFMPPVGQGRLGVVCRKDDLHIMNLLEGINQKEQFKIVHAQRKFLDMMDGGCQVPLGIHVELIDGVYKVCSFVSDERGSAKIVINHQHQDLDVAVLELVQMFNLKGAKDIIRLVRSKNEFKR